MVYTDTPDANAPLIAGTVQTAAGSVAVGNNPGDTGVQITIGTLAGGSRVALQYQVRIANPLPADVAQVRNQGTVSAANYPSLVTDDPDTLDSNDSTVTAVTAAPLPVISKQVLLEVDANGNGAGRAGRPVCATTVRLQNQGNADLAGAEFTDLPDPNTTLVVGSVRVSQGTVTLGNAAGEQTVSAQLGTLAGGAAADISFSVVIVSPLPAGVSSVRNQGILNSGNAPSVLSDDPQTTEPGDPTITSVFAQPRMIAAKRAVLIETGVQDGVAGAGDTLLYEVELRNDGDTAATNAVFSDTPDAATPLVAGSVVAGPQAFR